MRFSNQDDQRDSAGMNYWRERFRGCRATSATSPERVGRPTRSGELRLEGQREAALPGDVVLRLVEPVAIELVHEVPALGADADAPQAVLEAHAVVAGELGPGAVRAQLMDADRAQTTHQVRADAAGAGAQRISQDDVGVVGELVEFAAAGEGGAANAVLAPAGAGADAEVIVEPSRGVEGRGPPEPPIGAAGLVQIGGAGQAAESPADGDGVVNGTAALRQRDARLSVERRRRRGQHQRHGHERERTVQHKILQKGLEVWGPWAPGERRATARMHAWHVLHR